MNDSISNNLRLIEKEINQTKDLRIHKDNIFNRRFSVLLSSLQDLSTVSTRLERNIKKAERLNRLIQTRFHKEDANNITEEGQRLRKELEEINKENESDLKSLHILQKYF